MKKTILLLILFISFFGWSQKAITVTQDIKDNNSRFKNTAVNTIVVFSQIPRTFSGASSGYQRTDGYHTLPNSTHRADGFYGIVTPDFDPATERLSPIYWDDNINKFTYSIISLTTEEIAALVEVEDDNTADALFDKHNQKGEQLFRRTYKKIWRRVHKNPEQTNDLTKAQGRKLARWFQPVYNHLRSGNWKEADKLIDGIIVDRAQDMLDVAGIENTINWFKTEISNYVTNEYDL